VAVTKLGLDPICQYVVWAGTLRQNQDVALLLQAVESLREKRPELRLLLISRDSEAIASMVEDYGVGGLAQTLTSPYEKVPTFLAAATVCAAPISDVPWTREFGISPLKVLEYLASGRPAVAASFPDLQFIAEYGLGFLYEPGHALSLAEALDRALDLSISEQEAMGRRARAYVLEHHDWRMTAGLVEGAIRQATERRRTNDRHPGST
jgi:glycosyltransferase involved in cell wall biosynthesis